MEDAKAGLWLQIFMGSARNLCPRIPSHQCGYVSRNDGAMRLTVVPGDWWGPDPGISMC